MNRLAVTGLTISCLFHLTLFAALVYQKSIVTPDVRFDLEQAAITVRLSFADSSQVMDDSDEAGQEVVVMPREARIATRRWTRVSTEVAAEPTVEEVDIDTNIAEPAVVSPAEFVKETPSDRPEFAATKPPVARQLHLAQPILIPTRTTQVDLSQNLPPSYPLEAFRRGWEGTAILRVWIAADGRVTQVELHQSSGYPILDAAAANAVRKWQGTPALENGAPREVIELLPVEFRLK